MDKMLMDAVTGLGSKTPKKKEARLHMHIHKMDDDKFYVQHEHRGGQEPMPDSEHAPEDIKALHAHIDKHYGKKSDSKDSEPGKD